MKTTSRPSLSKRERKIRSTLAAAGVGIATLAGLAMWLDATRNTDLADPTAGVTSSFLGGGDVASPLRFRDVATELGLVMQHGPGERSRLLTEDTGSGLAWGDVDGDGDWDLYLVNYPGPAPAADPASASNRLFRNDGGVFADITEEAGVGDAAGFGMGASFVDYDNDGALDLYVTNRGPNRLYRGRGDGHFDEVAAAAGVDDPGWSTGAAWGDFDRDGNIDLYVCNYVRYDQLESASLPDDDWVDVPFSLNPNSFDPQPNSLFRGLGDGSFEQVAALYSVDDPAGRSLAATFCDLDGDGWLDLYVNNDVSTNRLYRNVPSTAVPGQRSFEEAGLMTGTADPRGSMGLSVGEIGGTTGTPDGLPDMFITHWVAQENALYESWTSPRGRHEYRDKIRRLRLGEVSIDRVGWGCAMVDLDLDGRTDLAVVNGSTLESKQDSAILRSEQMFLFWSAGDRFVEAAGGAGDACSALHSGRGLAAADFDLDGDVDLAIMINQGSPLLLRNDTETKNSSLSVLLEGPAASLFGARVELRTGEQQQSRWYGSDVSYLSMHAPEIIFGLGSMELVDELTVTWADGRVTRLSELSPGKVVVSP